MKKKTTKTFIEEKFKGGGGLLISLSKKKEKGDILRKEKEKLGKISHSLLGGGER